MKKKIIGKSGLQISEVGVGSWTIGGPNYEVLSNGKIINSGWALSDEKDATEALSFAVANGINHIDSADVYGNGHAERIIGRAFPTTENIVISSKVGYFKGTAAHAYDSLHIRHQCEQSLKNLNRDYIDIYYFHKADFGKNDEYLDDAIDMMLRLKSEGKIREIGFSAYSEKAFKKYIPIIKPAVVQAWVHLMDYHFIAKNSTLMKLCSEYNIAFIGFSPFNQGILLNKYSNEIPNFPAGDHRRDSVKFKKEYLRKASVGIAKLIERFGPEKEDLASVAISFVLAHENVFGVVAGFRNIDQIKTILSYNKHELNSENLSFIRNSFR